MADIAIRLHNVSKRYPLHLGWYGSLSDTVNRLGRRLLGTTDGPAAFWALKNVSFEVERGDVLGLIGSNGAGKSTILKILSRVTAPTRGHFTIRGRLGALIEVGAGFHPDLTGRENVYLNGSLMGMRRREVAAKFDRIVSFAEVHQFIDTPVKYYSSGMEVRLGFAVAAHTDPDILLVDEVLAVGDASFQMKCLNKLAELKEEGKTVILVSHSMADILRHSRKVLWIQGGEVRAFGDPETVVEHYLRAVREQPTTGTAAFDSIRSLNSDPPIRIRRVSLCCPDGRVLDVYRHGDAVCVDIEYDLLRPTDDPVFEVTIQDAHGHPLGGITSRFADVKVDPTRDAGIVRLTFRPLLFVKGQYTLNVHIRDHSIERYHDVRRQAAFLIVDGPSLATRALSGHILYPHAWELL